jgi:hypothetical protein
VQRPTLRMAALFMVTMTLLGLAPAGGALSEAADDAGTQPSPQSSVEVAPAPYVVGNFSVAASLSDDGLKIHKLLFNPPVLGQWLQPVGHGELRMTISGRERFSNTGGHAVFPESVANFRSQDTGVEAEVSTFAPLSSGTATSSFNSFLPVVVVQVTLTNRRARSQRIDTSYALTPDKPGASIGTGNVSFNGQDIPEVFQRTVRAQAWLMGVSAMHAPPISWQVPSGPDSEGALTLGATVALDPGKSVVLSWVLGIYDSREYTARHLASRLALQRYLLELGLESLGQQTQEFIAALPRTGDADIDLYLRWYLSPAILLTKGTSTGDVLTMGYSELNQRDSFWTSGAHLIYWPDLELKMLHESMSHQHASGQVPMTILPTIDRTHNIDGNEYFILRIARYYQWVRDDAFLKEALPHVKKAVQYLQAQDREHIGLPEQTSYWADWKDVPGVEGRMYAPHFDLLWLAALKSAQSLARSAADAPFEQHLTALYDRASERINRDVSQGGLWNGTHYVDLWRDGRRPAYMLEDQTVAAIWNVIPRERLESIYATLNASNESSFGVRETYPYITPGFNQGKNDEGVEEYGAGEYHNGGIWPWLNFADAWGRFLNGHATDADRILKEVGHQQLVRSHQYAPGEFLNGETGKTGGFPIQGWDADILSAIYFGAFGLDRPSARDVAVRLKLTGSNDFTTTIRVPEGDLLLTRRDGNVNVDKTFAKPLHVTVTQ